jgi:nucleolar protein 6
MSSAQSPKLTKKQKKGIAFRERKQGRSDRKNGRLDGDQDGQEVPVQEAVDQIEIQDGDVEVEETAAKEGSRKADAKGKGKDKAFAVRGDTKVAQSAAKRKREEGEAHEGEKQTQKKIKRDPADGVKGEAVEKGTKKQAKQRFILFVGKALVCVFIHTAHYSS